MVPSSKQDSEEELHGGKTIHFTPIGFCTSQEHSKPVFEQSPVPPGAFRRAQSRVPLEDQALLLCFLRPLQACLRRAEAHRRAQGRVGAAAAPGKGRRLASQGAGAGKCSLVLRLLICLLQRIPGAK